MPARRPWFGYASSVYEIGLFPLGLVLLPDERIPLHVFEARYRELIGRCLADRSLFGIVLALETGLVSVGTKAEVVEVLETRSEEARLRRLTDLLAGATETLRLQQAARKRAGGERPGRSGLTMWRWAVPDGLPFAQWMRYQSTSPSRPGWRNHAAASKR